MRTYGKAKTIVLATVLAAGWARVAVAVVPCQNGLAGPYPCRDVDLLAFVPLEALGGGTGNDVWGWTDPATGKEWAILGTSTGTVFVDISVPESPVFAGILPAHNGIPSLWRDVEVYANHAFIVSEASGHGMQVFDLTQLRDVVIGATVFSETARYGGFGSSHTITIDTDTGFAYANGSNTCSGGPHMVDIRNPDSPMPAGCNAVDGYTHDSQCVIYHGPDASRVGREICVNSNEDTLTIFDVTAKSSPVMLSRRSYPGAVYTHQGWLTADHAYFLLDDELDEQGHGFNTRTYIWNVSDLQMPLLIGIYTATTTAIDHQQFIHDGFAYQANYTAGLRVLDTREIANGRLSEVAFFDVVPGTDVAEYGGSWSNFPFFASGTVVVSGIESGMFVLRPTLADLAISISDGPDPVRVGDELTYAITVANRGPTYATDVTVTDALPAGATLVSATTSQGEGCASAGGPGVLSCHLGTIARSTSASVTIVAFIVQEGTIANTASVAAAETDVSPADNTASAQTQVIGPVPGSVPDGGSVPGVPLLVRKSLTLPGGLDLSWGASCSPQVSDYSVHEGTLGFWYNHTARVCSTGGSTSAAIAPGGGGRYYLIVPMAGGREGSYGTASSGSERPRSAAACTAEQDVTACD